MPKIVDKEAKKMEILHAAMQVFAQKGVVKTKIIDIAGEHDIPIIADEIYGAYSFSNPFMPMITLDNVRDRLITLNSFSKDFTMTGWRVGHVIAPKEIIQVIQQINENVVFTAPAISQRAAYC